MNTYFSERSAAIVAETLALMYQNRVALEEAMARYMSRQGPHDPSATRSWARVRAITDMLFDHAAQPGGKGRSAAIAATAQHHHALAIGGEHYSSFGDGLKPIMKDVLGSKATASVVAAWGDAYWAIVRTLFDRETRLAA
jgi:hemoglobin-like flavoprotein